MNEIIWICGKPVMSRIHSLGRDEYIIKGMSTPYGMNMSQQRAIRFFGKQWDKKHGGKTK
jgi:hypothetical protein